MKRHERLAEVVKWFQYQTDLGKLETNLFMIKNGYKEGNLEEKQAEFNLLKKKYLNWMNEEV